MTEPSLNPVGFLQEFCQKYNAAPFPIYVEIGCSGPDHCREFVYQCMYDGFQVTAKARQKKQGKFEAAKRMIEVLKENNYFDKFERVLLDCPSPKGYPSPTKPGSVKGLAGVSQSKNPISALQEYCQKKAFPSPVYFENSTHGGFVCECTFNEKKTYGHGTTKKCAKTLSALNMCVELQILCASEEMLKSNLAEIEESYSDKNAITALQELCVRKKMSEPVYTSKEGHLKGFFIIVCHVGKISGEGIDTTKKGAKMLAANNVLKKLSQQGLNFDSHFSGRALSENEPRTNGSMFLKLESRFTQMNTELKPRVDLMSKTVLEEFNLDSDEEVNDDVKPQIHDKDVDPSLDLDVTNMLESLALDDSVVEVEPSAVPMKTEVPLETEIESSTVTVTTEDLPETENVHSEQVKSQGKKKRLSESDHQDGHIHSSKTPTSETLLKWAQKDTN